MQKVYNLFFGPLAHPVERTHGMGEVSGSSPLWSTALLKTSHSMCEILSFPMQAQGTMMTTHIAV